MENKKINPQNLKIDVSSEDVGMKLDKWIKKHFPHIPFSLIQKLYRKGDIRVNGKRIKGQFILEIGDQVKIPPIVRAIQENEPQEVSSSPEISLTQEQINYWKSTILYEDDDLIIINKPGDIAVQGGSKQDFYLELVFPYLCEGLKELRILHRLDKQTSGLLMIAKSLKSAQLYGQKFKEHQIQKTYYALVHDVPSPRKGTIRAPIHKQMDGKYDKMQVNEDQGVEAITQYHVIETAPEDDFALVKLKPHTGRTHQLRVHMSHIGHPIVADYKYGAPKASFDGIVNPKDFPIFLHAGRLEFDTLQDKRVEVVAKMPDYFLELLAKLDMVYNDEFSE